MDKLNELSDFLGEKMADLQKLLIKEPVLVEIKKTVDEFFEDKECNERQQAQYTIAIMSQKIVDLEREKEEWKDTATKHQTK